MYSPQYALETDRKFINPVIEENPFATLVYQANGLPQSFHLPLILEGDKLIGHMAKANPAWQALDEASVLVIFHGPHCYISPVWYGTEDNVPTWNYIAIQVRGKVKIHQDEAYLRNALSKLGHKYDPEFKIEKNIDEHKKLLLAIVGIEIEISAIVAKFKLAQSKSEEERKNVITILEQSPSTTVKAVAHAMKQTLL